MRRIRVFVASMVLCSTLMGCGSSQTTPTAASTAATAASTENIPVSSGDSYTIVVAGSASEDNSDGIGVQAFKEYVEEKSGGRLTVETYWNSQLGSDREMIESLQLGNITMVLSSLTNHANFVPALSVLDGPYVYRTKEEVDGLFADEQIKKSLEQSYNEKGLHYCGQFFMGFRELTCNFEVNSLADIKGLKIRVMQSPIPLAIWTALGTNPTSIAYSELYTALQNGTVDAEEGSLELIAQSKFYEVQDYVVLTHHVGMPIIWAMNNDFYQNLSEDLRQIVDDGLEIGIKAAAEHTEKQADVYEKELKDNGCTFITLSDGAMQEFVDATESVRTDLQNQYPDFWNLCNETLTKLRQ